MLNIWLQGFDVCRYKVSEGLISLMNVQSRIVLPAAKEGSGDATLGS